MIVCLIMKIKERLFCSVIFSWKENIAKLPFSNVS